MSHWTDCFIWPAAGLTKTIDVVPYCACLCVCISNDLWPWPRPWAHPGCTLTWSPSCASLVAIRPFAREKKRFSCQHKSARITWPLTLTLSTPWMHADLESIVCKSGGDPAICPWEEAIFMPAQKCPYHVTFDLDLEHTLDARWPGIHRVQVWWRSGHLPAKRSDLRKSLQTDGRTDRRRTPHDCISSWNELKITAAYFPGLHVFVTHQRYFTTYWV